MYYFWVDEVSNAVLARTMRDPAFNVETIDLLTAKHADTLGIPIGQVLVYSIESPPVFAISSLLSSLQADISGGVVVGLTLKPADYTVNLSCRKTGGAWDEFCEIDISAAAPETAQVAIEIVPGASPLPPLPYSTLIPVRIDGRMVFKKMVFVADGANARMVKTGWTPPEAGEYVILPGDVQERFSGKRLEFTGGMLVRAGEEF